MRYIIILVALLLLAGCGNESAKTEYNGKILLKEKCAVCHNLKMPPSTYENEKAPPMMAVVFHLKDFMKIKNDEDKARIFIPFIQNYVITPSAEKSYCDKESLKTYGVMPSQKGNVTQEELKAIALYMYDFYDQQRYLKEMQAKAAFDALSKGEQLIRRNGCLNCHDTNKAKVGPSFKMIAKKDAKEITTVIQNGSQGQWEGFHNMMMPPFKTKFTQEELNILQEWIRNLDKTEVQKPWRIKNDI